MSVADLGRRAKAASRLLATASTAAKNAALGVVAIIYETRPNVTSDAAGLCLKSGNAVLLRGSGTALRSNQAIVSLLREGAGKAGLPEDVVILVEDVSHAAAVELMQLTG